MKYCTQCGMTMPANGDTICGDCRNQNFYLPDAPRGWSLVRWVFVLILAGLALLLAYIVL